MVSNDDKTSVNAKNENFDDLLNVERSRRTAQNFYALWLILSGASISKIKANKLDIIKDIKSVINQMKKVKSKEEFEKAVIAFWLKHK